MIIGAAIIPTAPLLVPGVSERLPDGIAPVCDAVDAVAENLADHDVAVLVGAATDHSNGQGCYDAAEASLATIGRDDITANAPVDADLIAQITRITQYPMYRGDPLPLDLSVLALLLGGPGQFAPIAVPQAAEFSSLVSVGAGIAEALADPDLRAVVIGAGDLSAGLRADSPLAEIDGAAEWDERVVEVVGSGRLEGLADLGPAEARRVGAHGWAPMAVVHGACARAKLGFVVRHYSAPRGVGYLVAHGA